jgi:uncharacterized small protein (DUF1192 family)
MAEEIGTIEKANSKMAIKVRVDQYNGKAYADIRNYYLNDDGDYAPTKKGVSFHSVEDLDQAILFLQAAREKLAATLAKKAA